MADIILNYTQAEYEAKITQLEGYYKSLETHLSRMDDLKQGMYEFWEDDNARMAGEILSIQIRSVKTAMDNIQGTLTFYETAVAQMKKTKTLTSTLLKGALSLLGLG